MKRILPFLLSIALAFGFFGCKKDIPVSDSLTGTWELRKDGGGWSAIVDHKPGNDTLMIFTGTNYSFYNKNKLVRSGAYTVKKDTSFMYGQLKNRIIFDGNTDDMRQFFDIQNNKLSFWIDAYDTPMVMYQRIK
ncbi:hypothetical protein [Mucilaginibacter sp.]|jgi:hypothetical protein|uniref:hypothetical protein n=1 Tax=Mucilaginibacter sp. TaxID=1882438 RepID=UPI002CC00B27|nr:hypothetical protein [Mucilaginibacter sp.]HTI59263.1 hypothetical protein [Mucilaginibacter sp.]